jgi:hypothetical protein
MTIVNDDSRVVNKLEASLTDNARDVTYNCHMFIVQATGLLSGKARSMLYKQNLIGAPLR